MASQNRSVFLDSSVLIAAAISANGSARELINRGFQGDCTLSISSDVIEECTRNLTNKAPKAVPLFVTFTALLPHRIEPTKAAVRSVAEIIEAKDAPIVAAAIAANATFIATYDRKHLLTKRTEIGEGFGITVATPDEILSTIGLPHLNDPID
jgi:predicted nucleic acid-binding protein